VKLSTAVIFSSPARKLTHQDKLLFAGSCFAERIGEWLELSGYDAVSNPAGIAYNPISMSQHIGIALRSEAASRDGYVSTEHGVAHYDFHSSLSANDQIAAVQMLDAALKEMRDRLHCAQAVFFTFGTSIVFERTVNGEVVNNCHKMPGHLFRQRYLSETEMYTAFAKSLKHLIEENPSVQVYLTVSPVRHLRHGAIDNQRSKARLIRLCEMLCADFSQCSYIPVYEYVLDELRDYRFYRHDDLIHLNEAGLGMVQERFTAAFISPESQKLMERVLRWREMQAHRIMHPETAAAKKFAERLASETA
jgi:hypothetical protein